MREKQFRPKRIVGSDTPPDVGFRHELKPHEGMASSLRSYRITEKEKEKQKRSWIVVGADASGELTIAPTLWQYWLSMLKEEVLKNGYVLLQDAIYAFARRMKERWGYGSSVTTRRYVKEATTGDNADFEKVWVKELGNVIVASERMKKRLELGIGQ